MKVLVTGATGKVGTRLLERFFQEQRFSGATVRALCHNRLLEENPRLEVISGSIADPKLVGRAMEGVTHVVHLATCKETPEEVMDVTVKGLFWLLEECRKSDCFRQFVLIGGDAAMGHFFYPHPVPVTETQEHSPYPGCYALSKVLEEVMLEQYYVQYNLNGCCLRAPWIMEKDDFKYSLSFGKDVFGGPVWRDLVSQEEASSHEAKNAIPVMLDPEGNPCGGTSYTLRIWSPPYFSPSTTPMPGRSFSTYAWTSPSTTERWRNTSRKPEAFPRSTS